MTSVDFVSGSTARFVVHEHYGTGRRGSGGGRPRVYRHHFDLRLENGGVLWSWALPKGVPTDPEENRLAVRVDDHDLGHLDVVDLTPVDGTDGAVAKSIWDAGTYTVVRSTASKVVFDLAGRRGDARYALIHTGGADWILHLMS